MAHAYSFYVWAEDKPPFQERFFSETSSLKFLADNGFDFNKLIRHGIPFLPPSEYNRLKRNLHLQDQAQNASLAMTQPSNEDDNNNSNSNPDSKCNPNANPNDESPALDKLHGPPLLVMKEIEEWYYSRKAGAANAYDDERRGHLTKSPLYSTILRLVDATKHPTLRENSIRTFVHTLFDRFSRETHKEHEYEKEKKKANPKEIAEEEKKDSEHKKDENDGKEKEEDEEEEEEEEKKKNEKANKKVQELKTNGERAETEPFLQKTEAQLETEENQLESIAIREEFRSLNGATIANSMHSPKIDRKSTVSSFQLQDLFPSHQGGGELQQLKLYFLIS